MNTDSAKSLQVACCGEPREMGRHQGTALRSKIHALCDYLAQLEPFRLRQPAWLPYA